ncbi:MAG: hypothetical protein JO306_00100 [Gemmatimonadetes bacterium]|nr:hypothetical protein [Gemmatimonadota bacterium]
MRNGVAVWEQRQGAEACKLRFVFRAGGWADVSQDGGCGFGFDVYAGGLYRRFRAASPRG